MASDVPFELTTEGMERAAIAEAVRRKIASRAQAHRITALEADNG